jgi:hypothetical protein
VTGGAGEGGKRPPRREGGRDGVCGMLCDEAQPAGAAAKGIRKGKVLNTPLTEANSPGPNFGWISLQQLLVGSG